MQKKLPKLIEQEEFPLPNQAQSIRFIKTERIREWWIVSQAGIESQLASFIIEQWKMHQRYDSLVIEDPRVKFTFSS